MLLGTVIGALFIAFITGALARFALPGPDPDASLAHDRDRPRRQRDRLRDRLGDRRAKAASWARLASFFVAVGLVVIYRRFVQKRPLWGRGAYRFPERGFGVEQYRERLKRAGIDPDQIGTQQQFGVLQPRPPMQPPLGHRPRPLGRRPDREPGALSRPARGAPRHGSPRRRGVHGGADAPAREPAGPPSARKRRSALNAQSPRDQRNVRTTIASASASWRWSPRASPSRRGRGWPSPGAIGDHGRVRLVADDLEVVPLAHRRLVDVAREDEIGAGVQQRTQHVVAARDRTLARRAPRRADQMVVEDGDAQRSRARPRRAVPPRARAAPGSTRRPDGGTAGPS